MAWFSLISCRRPIVERFVEVFMKRCRSIRTRRPRRPHRVSSLGSHNVRRLEYPLLCALGLSRCHEGDLILGPEVLRREEQRHPILSLARFSEA